MILVNQILLMLHFLGLAMGLSVPFSSMVMQGLVDQAAPADRAVLARFAPVMSRVGVIGLILLWVTGGTLVFTKWGGFGNLAWQFDAKLTAVAVLTILVAYIHWLMHRARTGDAAAAARIPKVGRLTFLSALTAVAFAVLTFD